MNRDRNEEEEGGKRGGQERRGERVGAM
jgi:hypothetical protein